MIRDRKNPLLFERSGDFNPGWLIFVVFSALGAGISVGALVAALRNASAWPAAIAALSFVAFVMLCTAIMVVPIARAKLLAPALKDSVAGIARAAAPFPGMDQAEDGPHA